MNKIQTSYIEPFGFVFWNAEGREELGLIRTYPLYVSVIKQKISS